MVSCSTEGPCLRVEWSSELGSSCTTGCLPVSATVNFSGSCPRFPQLAVAVMVWRNWATQGKADILSGAYAGSNMGW